MGRKKILLALPPSLLEQTDFVARCEHRTRSDCVREALRLYIDNFRRAHGLVASHKLPPLSDNPFPASPSLQLYVPAPSGNSGQ
jgi:hypothetical protein